jgi:hypothetical protein
MKAFLNHIRHNMRQIHGSGALRSKKLGRAGRALLGKSHRALPVMHDQRSRYIDWNAGDDRATASNRLEESHRCPTTR